MPTPDAMTLSANTTFAPSVDIPEYNEQPTNTSPLNELLNTTHLTEELLSPIGHYAMGTVLAIIALVGLVQNSSLLIVLNKRQNPLQIEFLIKVLLLTNLLICLFMLPFSVTSSFAKRWLFGSIGCNWYGFSMFFLGVFSINVLTAICIERYFTVKQILQLPASSKTRVLVISLVVSALGALVCSTLPLLGVSSYKPEGVGSSCSVDWKSKRPQDQAYFIIILIGCYIVPLCTIVICYTRIYIQVTAKMRRESQLSQRRVKREIHLAKAIIMVTGSFVITWSPYAIMSLVTIITDTEAVPPFAFSIPAIFSKCSVFSNSLVYVFMNRDLRLNCIKHLGLRRNSVPDEEVLALPNEQQQ